MLLLEQQLSASIASQVKGFTIPQRRLLCLYYQASPLDLEVGSQWYATAYKVCLRLAATYNIPVETVAGVGAALSPRLPWSRNVAIAEQVISDWHDGTALAKGVLRANLNKAKRILNGSSPEEVLGGLKVSSFYDNLLLRECSVTIDTHAISASLGERVSETEAAKYFKNSLGRYESLANDYRVCAKHLGIRGYEFQEIIWVAWRRIVLNVFD